MLNNLPPAILLDISILAATLAWGMGFYIADRRIHLISAFAIGGLVVLAGYSLGSTGAPAWLVIAGPTALDFLPLWYVMRTLRKMTIAYVSTWLIYIGLHILLSAALHYDNLIPPWHLHG
jgi:hypothetical protein